jgi:hypothetical protein
MSQLRIDRIAVHLCLSFAKTCAALSRITIAIVLRSGLLTIVMARGPVGLMCALARRARQLCLACIA